MALLLNHIYKNDITEERFKVQQTEIFFMLYGQLLRWSFYNIKLLYIREKCLY